MTEKYIPERIVFGSHFNAVTPKSSFFDLAPATCRIETENFCQGTGFLCKFSNLFGLFTNNHVLKNVGNFHLTIQDKTELVTSNHIKWFFTDSFLDVSFIILDEKLLSQLTATIFVEECEEDLDKIKDIAILQYPRLTNKVIKNFSTKSEVLSHQYVLCEAEGEVMQYLGHFIQHTVSTEDGSSGGLIVEKQTKRVIGIHIGGCTETSNKGIRIRDAMEMICWEKSGRILYPSGILPLDGQENFIPREKSVCDVTFISSKEIKNVGFLCTMNHENSYLKGLFLTNVNVNIRGEFDAFFNDANIKLHVKREHIGPVFTYKALGFTFITFTEHFMKHESLISKLKFLSVSQNETSYKSNVEIHLPTTNTVHGIVSEIDGDYFYVRDISFCPRGAPILNDKKEVIGIVTKPDKSRCIASNVTKIQLFIWKKRVLSD